MMDETRLAIKVDVDTWLGTREGLPRLRDILDQREIPASFFLTLGPDRSGLAIRRIFTQRGFLSKMLRTRAPSAYGLRTLMMGTLLPAPMIGRGQEALFRSLAAEGHELGLHAWDHVTWHDGLWRMGGPAVRGQIYRGLREFMRLTGMPAQGFAAPAWRISFSALAALEAAGLKYISAARGEFPFFPVLFGHRFRILEIPTTLPTADEVLGCEGVTADNLHHYYLERISPPGLHVLTVHAEMEGRGLASAFERILDVCMDRGVRFQRLIDVAESLNSDDVPVCEIVRTDLPGRAGLVCCQKP